jgi:glycosyltransferase involved in cell wall biosynthesis
MLSVLMATRNGARSLPTVLDAYSRLEPPPGGWKLIIVDNGSTDTTKEVIGAFAQKLPLTYVLEPKRGKNAALNTGLSHIEGDLIVLTDDDAVPRPDWLAQLRVAADSQPSFSIFGGVVLPRWEVNPEPWILSWVPLDAAFALTDPAWPEGPTTPLKVFGPNSAYRANIFKSGYHFNPTIGPSGVNYAMGSEYEFHVRLIRAGFTAWHCRRAVVEHIVRKAQMDKGWVLGRAFRSGRGYYRVEGKDTIGSPRFVFGIPRFFLREIMTQALQVVRTKLSRDECKLFAERWELNYLIGKAYEARTIYRQSAQSKSVTTRE